MPSMCRTGLLTRPSAVHRPAIGHGYVLRQEYDPVCQRPWNEIQAGEFSAGRFFLRLARAKLFPNLRLPRNLRPALRNATSSLGLATLALLTTQIVPHAHRWACPGGGLTDSYPNPRACPIHFCPASTAADGRGRTKTKAVHLTPLPVAHQSSLRRHKAGGGERTTHHSIHSIHASPTFFSRRRFQP